MTKSIFFIPFTHNGGIETSLENIIKQTRDVEIICEFSDIYTSRNNLQRHVKKRIFPLWYSKLVYQAKNSSSFSKFILLAIHFVVREISILCFLRVDAEANFHSYYQFNPLSLMFKSVKKKTFWFHGPAPNSKFFDYSYRFVLKKYERVITVSEGLRSDLLLRFPDSTIDTYKPLSYPINVSDKYYNDLQSENDSIRLLTVSRVNFNQKDFKTIYAALRRFDDYLMKIGSDKVIKYTIVGDGPDMHLLQEFTTLKRIEVFIVGFVDDPIQYYLDNDYFLFSSHFEGLGLTVLEALCFGMYCIASDCNFGPREIIESVGYGKLFSVGQSDEIFIALKAINEQEMNVPSKHTIAHSAVKYKEKLEIENLRIINL